MFIGGGRRAAEESIEWSGARPRRYKGSNEDSCTTILNRYLTDGRWHAPLPIRQGVKPTKEQRPKQTITFRNENLASLLHWDILFATQN